MVNQFHIFILIAVFINLSIGTVIKPPGLRTGDVVAFISPGSTDKSPNAAKRLDGYKRHVIESMAELGLKVLFSPNAFAVGPSGLAGNDSQRVDDIHWAFKNPKIKGIFANRGGWGCNRIIDKLDYSAIRQNPKIFMGYSDMTGCCLAINSQTNLVTFHGPMGDGRWGNLNSVYLKQVLIQGQSNLLLSNPPDKPIQTIVPGKARGRLIGGNLSVFSALLGSIYIPSSKEPFILFLEDIGESPFWIDRMLTALHLAGYFKRAQGLIWGTCKNCNPDGPGKWTALEVLQQKWSFLNIPSYSGALIGHGGEQFTLPLGTQVEMDAGRGTIRLLEAGVLRDNS